MTSSGENSDLGNAIFSEGNSAYVAGYMPSGIWHVEALDSASGDNLWMQDYDSGVWSVRVRAISGDSDVIYITGASGNESGTNIGPEWRVEARDAATGTLIWGVPVQPHTGRPHDIYLGTNAVYVAGFLHDLGSGDGNDEAYLVALDPSDGSIIWDYLDIGETGSYGMHQLFRGVTEVNGIVYVSGQLVNKVRYDSGQDWAILALDPLNGILLDEMYWSSPGTKQDYASKIVEQDGILYTSGYSVDWIRPDSRHDWRVEARDLSNGNLLWERGFSGPGALYDNARGITATPDAIYVSGGVGNVVAADSGLDWRVEAYDPLNGDTVWLKEYSSEGTHDDMAYDIHATGENVYVIGPFFNKVGPSTRLDWYVEAWRRLDGIVGPFCGDGTCNNGEDCNTCSVDCIGESVVVATCDACFKGRCDGSCNTRKEGDSCYDCNKDVIEYCCGDGVCDGFLDYLTCPSDCDGPEPECVFDVDCDDSDACTADSCNAGVCSNELIPGCGSTCEVVPKLCNCNGVCHKKESADCGDCP